ncbi:coilin [Tenrec ecaudatus]|uniref:coilin n=1 Tax=Tenrec ecaudatus TaxID=94439 RepID=UPI003F5995ED
MAASETVRLRLQFDYPPPATPDCTVFWLLVDLNRCRVVTDLISLVRQRFGFSSGAFLGLYLDGGLLPPGESARLVRDNDCLRVKLEASGTAESLAAARNGDSATGLPRKGKKRAFTLEEAEDGVLGNTYSKKHWKKQEQDNSEKAPDVEAKAAVDQSARKKSKRRTKASYGVVGAEGDEARRKSPKRKEKGDCKRQVKTLKSPKAQVLKEWALQNCSPLKVSSTKTSLVKVRKKGARVGLCAKESPSSSSESESSPESSIEGRSGVLEARKSPERTPTGLPKAGPVVRNVPGTKTILNLASAKGKAAKPSSSSSDSSSESDGPGMPSQDTAECTAGVPQPGALVAGRGGLGPGASSQLPSAIRWKHSEASTGRQGPPLNLSLPASFGRGWGRGEDLSWKGPRGRGVRGRGRGRGQTISCVLNRSSEYQKQPQLTEILTNSSTIIQNPAEVSQKDYSVLPLLAAAPQVGEKIAFKLLELTSDYSPDVSDYKEGKILSHNPETQQVDIEILSSLPALKEPGKFDLVYHNENGTEVVEYAVTQEKRITVFWRELIDPRLIVDSTSNTTSSTDLT